MSPWLGRWTIISEHLFPYMKNMGTIIPILQGYIKHQRSTLQSVWDIDVLQKCSYDDNEDKISSP